MIGKDLKDLCVKLLKDKNVDYIIGYTRGTLPLKATPYFIKDEKEVDKLIFDFTCSNNLAAYLQKSKIKPQTSKLGIIAKGCDGRAVVQYIVEKQFKKEDVVIIGVPCEGVVDLKKVKEKVGGKEILGYKIEASKFVLEGRDFKLSFNKEEILDEICLFCKYPNPPVYDVFIGTPREVSKADKFELIAKLEKLSPDERWEHFEHEISKCIRCYACRNVCPVCYCEECVVDQSTPQWFGKSINISDTTFFHVVRILHVAGRCVSCGACSRACTVGVNLAPLGIRIEKEISDRFDYAVGLDLEAMPLISAYKEDDKQEFIM